MRRLLFVVRRPGMCYTVCNRMHERMRRTPYVQIILTTHSPAVIMEGWLDAVTEVSDISTEADGFRLPPTINC